MESNFKFVNFFETPTVLQKINFMTDSTWLSHTCRITNCFDYVKTKTIVVRGNSWFNCDNEYLSNNEKIFESELLNLHNFFIRIYKKGQLVDFIINKLYPNSIISSHLNSNLKENTKRYIIPVSTTPEVNFQIANEKKDIFANEIWEINNSYEYKVENYSPYDCIHIIADWRLND